VQKSFLIGVAVSLAIALVASASTCPTTTNTWCFGATGSTTFVTQGSTYSTPGGSTVTGSVSVYAEQLHNYTQSNSSSTTGVIVTGSNVLGGTSHPTIGAGSTALFAVNDNVYDEGIGIAPYNPVEGSGSNFSSQDGITDAVKTSTGTTNGSYANVLEIELGSNIAAGTSLQFLLQAGIGASGDQVDVWNTGPTNSSSTPLNVNKTTMTYDTTTALGAISTNGTTSQFSIVKNTSGIEWVAIVADCHYLLLTDIVGMPPMSGVPEPRFYGLLLAGFLGLCGVAYKRRTAQVNA
jgi:hypothetical protein